MIDKYWKMIEWLTTHKMGYLALLVYLVTTVVCIPFIAVLLVSMYLLEHEYVIDFYRNIKLMIKGGKHVDFR